MSEMTGLAVLLGDRVVYKGLGHAHKTLAVAVEARFRGKPLLGPVGSLSTTPDEEAHKCR